MWICSWSGVDFVRARCESRGGLGRARVHRFGRGCGCVPRSRSCDEIVELLADLLWRGARNGCGLRGGGARWVAALRVPKGARPVDESALDGLRVWPAVVVRGTRGLVEVELPRS